MLSLPLNGQKPIDEFFGKPVLSIPIDFKKVEVIETDQENNIYLLAPSRHRLYKMYHNTAYDSVQTIGGKGIGDEGFNYPSRIVVPNRQSVFVLDELNRRIVQLNTNLKVTMETNFLTLLNKVPFSELSNLLPIGFTVGPTGELFLLNQEDLKVWKFTFSGNLERTFSGLDYGEGSVIDPCDIAINRESDVFVISCEDQSISVFDLYGTFQYKLSVPAPFMWDQAKIFARTVTYFTDSQLYFYNTFTHKAGPHLSTQEDIIDLDLNGEFMFVLFEKRINLYRINK